MRLRTVLLYAVGLGLALRLLAVLLQGVPGPDGPYYMAMGASVAQGQGFLIPYAPPGPVLGPQPSHHYAPLWPLTLALGYTIAGFSFATSMAVSLLVSFLFVLVVFLTTRDLLGTPKAWIVTAVVALSAELIELTDQVYSENLLALCYVATIWAILRSLKDERFIVLAGVFAAAGYLTKASVGYFFFLAGAAGFLWRFSYVRWGILRDRYYLAAIGLFGTIAGSWVLRNLTTFGWPNWQTSPKNDAAVAFGFTEPLQFLPALGVKVVLFALFFATLGLFFAPQILRAVRRWREEEVSALWLAVVLPAILGVVFAAAFELYEPSFVTPLWAGHLRYVVMAFVPLLWLALRDADVPSEVPWRRWLASLGRLRPRLPSRRSLLVRLALVGLAGLTFYAYDRMVGLILLAGAVLAPSLSVPRVRARVVVGLVLVLALTSVNAATFTQRAPEFAAGATLADLAQSGDVVALVGRVDVVSMYPYLSDRNLTFVQWDLGSNVTGADFVLTRTDAVFPGYGLLATFFRTGSYGLVDEAYFAVSHGVRGFLGITIPPGTASQGDLFLYRAVP